MHPGDFIEFRSVYRDRVRWAFRRLVVADDGDEIALYLAPGVTGVWMGRDGEGRYLKRWVSDEPPHRLVWHTHHVLSVTRRGEAHSIWHMWDEEWRFKCWYVQLQDPLRESPGVVETMDHALDVVVAPDGTWRWKDEEDFAEAIALRVFTPEEAAAVREEGERVIAAPRWPTGWETWRPWLPDACARPDLSRL